MSDPQGNFWRVKPGEQAPTWNIANMVTVVRVILIPLFIWAFWEPEPVGRGLIAFAIFALAAGTDKVDGQLARSRNLITDFGKLGDSIADKGLIAVALIMLSVHGMLWWWVTILVIAREVFITAMRLSVVKKEVMAAGWHGKVKMAFQCLGAGCLIFPQYTWPWEWLTQLGLWIGWILVGVSLYMSVVSAVEYTRDARRIRGE